MVLQWAQEFWFSSCHQSRSEGFEGPQGSPSELKGALSIPMPQMGASSSSSKGRVRTKADQDLGTSQFYPHCRGRKQGGCFGAQWGTLGTGQDGIQSETMGWW